MSKKDLRARVEPDDYSAGNRILDRLGRSMQDTLEGWWYRLIHGDGEAEVAAADYFRAKADVAALERREERLDERIEQLEEEREAVREELREAKKHLDDAEDDVVVEATSTDTGTSDEGSQNSLEDVARELLVEAAHGAIGTNGITAGHGPVKKAALRAGTEPEEVIEEMRRQAEPAAEAAIIVDDALERGFRTDLRGVDPVEGFEWDILRQNMAEEVLDDDEVEWSEIPDQ